MDNRGNRRDFSKEKRSRPDVPDRNNRHAPKKDIVLERLANVNGPTTNLPCKEGNEPKKFTGRCRLFVGNLPSSITEEEFKKMFEPYGETAEEFLNKPKQFGFIKLDTRQHAEAAKAALDFSQKDGKVLRVRFATHGAALKVKNLHPMVSNELLEYAFSIFGDVERAIVIVDDRGRSLGEGIVEYSRKQSAQNALKRCSEGCFMITSAPRPVLVETLEQKDEEDGLPEKNFPKNSEDFLKEREIGPRLAEPGSFEYDYANRWKQLYEVEKQKRENVEKEIKESRRRLDEQMEFSLYEHETNMLREKLRHMEEQNSMYQRDRPVGYRREDERRHEEDPYLRPDDMMRRRDDDMMRNDDMMQMQGMGANHGDYMGGPPGPMNSQRQSRFDPPSHYMGGPPMGPGNAPPPHMRGDQHDMIEDYSGMEPKRRRY